MIPLYDALERSDDVLLGVAVDAQLAAGMAAYIGVNDANAGVIQKTPRRPRIQLAYASVRRRPRLFHHEGSPRDHGGQFLIILGRCTKQRQQ